MARPFRPLPLVIALVLTAGLAGLHGFQPTAARAAGSASLTAEAAVSPAVPSMKNCDGVDTCAPPPSPHPSPSPQPSGPPAFSPSPSASPAPSAGTPSGSAPTSLGISALPPPSPATNPGPPNLGIIAYSGPLLVSTAGSITPTGTLTLTGYNLGAHAGTLELRFSSGGWAFMQPTSWSDTQVAAILPAGLRGQPDQTAQLQVITAAGQPSNLLDIQFVATRETIPLDGNLLRINCGSESNADLCPAYPATPAFVGSNQILTFVGSHFSECCFSGTSGTDEYAITLQNGWGFARLDLQEDRAAEADLISYGLHGRAADPQSDPGVTGGIDPNQLLNLLFPGLGSLATPCILDDGPGSFGLKAQPATGATTIDLKIAWYVNANCSPAVYSGTIWITGPAGVPYH